MSGDIMDKLIEKAYKEGRIKKLKDIKEKTIYENDYFGVPEIYYCVADSTTGRNYHIGDIIFVPKFIYEDGSEGNNHLFVIIKENNIAMEFEYFCFLPLFPYLTL